MAQVAKGLKPQLRSVPQGAERSAARSEIPLVLLGTSRLPACASGDGPSVLMIELTLDGPEGRILDVASSVPLAGYTRVLRGLLVGQPLNAVEAAAQRLCEHYRGPLLQAHRRRAQKRCWNSSSVKRVVGDC